jgi:hypothetical protein
VGDELEYADEVTWEKYIAGYLSKNHSKNNY